MVVMVVVVVDVLVAWQMVVRLQIDEGGGSMVVVRVVVVAGQMVVRLQIDEGGGCMVVIRVVVWLDKWLLDYKLAG